MKVFFDTCHDAIECATSNKRFGLYYSQAPTESQDVHVHDCCEIFLALSAGNGFLIDDKIYGVAYGDLFIINQFEAHKVSAKPNAPFVRYSLHIHPSFIFSESSVGDSLGASFYGSNKVDRVRLNEEQINKFIALFTDLKTDYGFGDDVYKRLRVTEVLLEVSRLTGNSATQDAEGVSNHVVQLAVSYINENFADKITLEDVAKSCFVSVNQLCLLFKKHLSTTVTKFITGKRISEAKKLLASGKGVTEAAFSSGFNDYANFIRVFKNSVGVSPGKFKTNTVQY